MDDSVSDPQDRNPSNGDDVVESEDRILADSSFGAASDSTDAYGNKGPWVGTIFMSYSSPDRTRTTGIARLLRGMGHEVFHDHESIKAGSKWRTFLSTGLKQADCLAVFWTRHARKSTWVAEEYETFAKMKPDSPLIPIYGDPKVPLPPLLSEHHAVDLGYAPAEEQKKGRPAGLALGLGAGRLAGQINGSIDTALGIAAKLRKARKSSEAVVQGVVRELKGLGYPVPKPELVEEGLRDLGGLGWMNLLGAHPLEPIKKPARWAGEKIRQAAPGALAGATAGALAALALGALMVPSGVQDALCTSFRSVGIPSALTAGCRVPDPQPPASPPLDYRPSFVTDNYYSVTNTALPYAFEREFRDLRLRAELMLDLLARLNVNTESDSLPGWPFEPRPVTVADWSILLDRWEFDEQRRWRALAAILEANQAQTDSILAALAATSTTGTDAPPDRTDLLIRLVNGMDAQDERLLAIESHLDRLRLEATDLAGRTATTRNSGIGDLILRFEVALGDVHVTAPNPGDGADPTRTDTLGTRSDTLSTDSDTTAPTRDGRTIRVPATRRELHYLLLPYSVGLVPPVRTVQSDPLGDARDKILGPGDSIRVGIPAAQLRALLLPFNTGAVSVLGLEGSELDPVIRELHEFLLDVDAGDSYTLNVPGGQARLLVLPYELEPLPPGLDLDPIQGVLDDLSRQLGLAGGDIESGDTPRDATGAAPGSVVELALTRPQVRALITPHILASPARLMESFRPRPDADGSGIELDVDLGPVVALHNRTYEQLLAMDPSTRGPGPTGDVDLSVLTAGQLQMQRTLDSLLQRISALEPGGRGVSVNTAVQDETGGDPGALDGPPGRIRYVRPGPGVFQAPQAVDTLPPAYPEEARVRGLEGIVDVDAVILTDSTVVVRRTAAAEGLEVLRAAAEARVAEWRFKPGTLNGEPIVVPLRVSLTFQLGPSGGPSGR